MLLAGLLIGVLQGQTVLSAQVTAPGNRPSAKSGASGSVGVSGSRRGAAPVQNGSGSRPAAGKRSAGAPSVGGVTQSPTADANGRVEVTGFPSVNSRGSADRPLLPMAGNGNSLGIRSGTPIQIKLKTSVDSGHAHNGDMLDGTLAAAVGGMAVGTPVRLTVVQAAPAGRIASYGELSIQVVSIADHRVLSDTITAQGKEGAKELPDAAPARGTDAVFTADQTISLPAA